MMRFLGVLLLAGCSGALDGALDVGSDADADADSDTDRDVDAGAGDGDADADADLDGLEGPANAQDFAGASSCIDGIDNDADGLEDCAEPSCLRSPECCAGDTLVLSDPFEGADVDLGAWRTFGSPAPQITAGRLSPNGDALYDSGVLSEETFTPGMEIVVSAVAEVPADCADLCLQTIGVGLTDKASLGPATGVDPVAAVVLSADGGRLLLVSNGSLVGETDGVATGSRIGVRLGTDGRVEGLVDGEVVVSTLPGVASASVPLRAVVYGRSPDGASKVDEVQVSTTACANPSSGVRAVAPVLAPREDTWDDASVGAPSVFVDAEERVLAYYETPTGIGRAMSLDGAAFDRQPTEGPVLAGPFGAPAALPRSGGVWLAVEAPFEGGGAKRIEIRASTDEPGEDFPIEALAAIDPGDGWTSFEDPSLVEVEGEPVLYLTLVDEWGIGAIGRIPLDGDTAAPGTLEVVLDKDLLGLVAPDGVAAPDVRLVDGWLAMWLETRDGLGTRIAYAASGDGFTWEALAGDVLAPSTGWDALAVGDPSAVEKDGALLLYYAGRAGSAESVGLVTRVLPWTE